MKDETPNLTTPVALAAREIERAKEIYVARQKDAEAARSAEITALNALNNAQREFDKLVGRMRAESPQQSDWKRPVRTGVEA
jgi:hypothetical protein